jgi:type II secretory pathway component PulM
VIRRFSAALAERTPRERVLLSLLALAAAPAAAWLLWAQPLIAARADAEAALAEARLLRIWVAERDAEFAARGGTSADSGTPAGIAGVERALREAGLREAAQRLEDGPDGRVIVEFADVDFGAAMAFADGAGALNYRVEAFRLDATDRPGRVRARLDLAPMP